jgi:RNA polymerase sigma-70 factor (ECF subfamily)
MRVDGSRADVILRPTSALLHGGGSSGVESSVMVPEASLRSREASAEMGHDAPSVTFEGFFDAERDRLFRMLCIVTGSRHEAEELSQEAFLRVWARWSEVRSMDEPEGYLHRTAMNLFRKRYRRASLALRTTIGLAPPQDAFDQVADRDTIAHALRSLTPRQRAAMVLTEMLGYSPQEAGSILGIKASTVRALTFQGRTALRAGREGADV